MELDTYSKCVRTILAVTLLITVVSCQRKEDGYCLVKDSEPYLHFSTRTAYEFVYGKDKFQPIPYCKPRQLWMFARHGTRNPSQKEKESLKSLVNLRDIIVRNHEERHTGSLCEDDVENLKKWQYNLTDEEPLNLTVQGWNENKYFALRLKSTLRDLLDIPYSREKFEIVSTDAPRTQLSAKAFIEGLFGPDSGIGVPRKNNSIIKLYQDCQRWITEVDDNPEAIKEVTLFKESPLMKEVIYNISTRLGFAYNVSFDDLYNMYLMCAYTKSWDYYNISPWCAAFTKEDLKVIEYVRDLLHYYKSGYGNDLNLKVGCPAVRDMMERFTRLANNEGQEPNAVLYFTHSKAVISLLARLGVAKDSYKLTHKNYFDSSRRKWQTSLISPFLANLIAVFYKCTEGEENRVLFLLNEQVLNYENCDVGLCSFNYLKQKFKTIVDPSTCNDQFCQYNAANIMQNSFSILITCFMYSIFYKFFM